MRARLLSVTLGSEVCEVVTGREVCEQAGEDQRPKPRLGGHRFVRRGAGPHYGPARRKFIIGMGTQNADLTGAMGVSGDSIYKPSGV
jgi:hypothetical protein